MTEEKNLPNPRAGIFLFLGKRKRRAFHIPTAPATAVRLIQKSKPERSFPPPPVQALPQAHSSIGKDSMGNLILLASRISST
jgi:hypothetical protein